MTFAGRSGVFENADGRVGDHVVGDHIVVARDEDAGLRAVERVILPDARLIAFNADAVEHVGSKVRLSSILALLPSTKMFTWPIPAVLPAISTPSDCVNENIGGDVGASSHGGTRSPDMLVTTFSRIAPPAPKPICTPFCAAPVVEPTPVTTLRE